MKRSLQSRRASEHHSLAPRQQAQQAREFLRSDEACDLLCYRGKHRLRSLYRFLAKKGIHTRRRFRTLLIKREALLAALDGGSKASPSQSPAGRG
jgi:hypothetical protein